MAEMKNHRRDRAEKMMAKYACGGSVPSSQSDGEPDMDTRSQRQEKKRGGHISEAAGSTTKKRLDKRKRYASGGGIDEIPKEKKSAKTQVNVIIAGGSKDAAPMPAPIPVMPPAPPVGSPPPGAPMGAPPMPMGRKRGGSVMPKNPSYPIEDGSGGGLGRIQKAAAARKTHKKSEKS